MEVLVKPVALLALMFTGAIFGFFYAWVCSTMWGLDTTDPRTAIRAMQAMNASVRNAVFFPAFFLTPVVLVAAAILAQAGGQPSASPWFAGAALTYLLGGLVLTVAVNVPMNEALAAVAVPDSPEAATAIWRDYSPRWQTFNLLRTLASGAALLMTGIGLLRMG